MHPAALSTGSQINCTLCRFAQGSLVDLLEYQHRIHLPAVLPDRDIDSVLLIERERSDVWRLMGTTITGSKKEAEKQLRR